MDQFLVLLFTFLAIICTQPYFQTSTLLTVILVSVITLAIVLLRLLFNNYTSIGIFFYTTNLLLVFIGVPWGFMFVFGSDMSTTTRILMLLTSPLLFLTLPFGIVQMLEQYDVLCRAEWVRPRTEKKHSAPHRHPMVSLHIPTYAEPSEMVIEILNKVAALDYDNFEVLVIDNNTKDETLWRPVEEHCKTLGSRFQFFHVDPLLGAKAGALNFALTKTSPKAEIVGVPCTLR